MMMIFVIKRVEKISFRARVCVYQEGNEMGSRLVVVLMVVERRCDGGSRLKGRRLKGGLGFVR